MIEYLYRRKMIREFLNQYSNKMWNQLIPLIVEIAIVYLRKNYNLAETNLEDFKNILDDLKNPNSELSASIKLDRENGERFSDTLPLRKEINTQQLNNNNQRISRSNSRGGENHKRMGKTKFLARKPSGNWRKGDDQSFKENENLSQLRRIYKSNSPDYEEPTDNEELIKRQNSANLNPNIYPSWWGGLPRGKQFEASSSDQLIEKQISPSRSVSAEKYKPELTEVFVPSDNENTGFNIRTTYKKRSKSISRPVSRSKSKPKNKSTNKINAPEIKKLIPPKKSKKLQKDGLYDNLKYVESKIRSQVIYDKHMHKNLKKQKDSHQDQYKEWKYKENVEGSQRENIQVLKLENKKNKVNYMISYDKDFKPEEVREKSKDKINSSHRSKQEKLEKQGCSLRNETRGYSYEAPKIKNDTVNSNSIQSKKSNSNQSQPNLYTRETANFNEENHQEVELRLGLGGIKKENEEYTRKLQNVLYRNQMTNNPNTVKYEELSFKKDKSDEVQVLSSQNFNNEDDERLSSYAPSERTKSIFQREYLNELNEKYRRSTSNNFENNEINVNFSNNSQNFSGSAIGSMPY